MSDLTKISADKLMALKQSVDAEIKARRADGRINTKRFKAMQHNNSSGSRGVTFNKSANGWQAKIAGKHIGYFKNKEDAVQARRLAEVQMWGGEAQ